VKIPQTKKVTKENKRRNKRNFQTITKLEAKRLKETKGLNIMNFIKAAQTENFIISIIALGDGKLNLTVKPTTDDAKVFCKAKKMAKAVPVTIEAADLGDKIASLENGVAALAAILKAA